MTLPDFLNEHWESVHRPRIERGASNSMLNIRQRIPVTLPVVVYYDTDSDELFIAEATITERVDNANVQVDALVDTKLHRLTQDLFEQVRSHSFPPKVICYYLNTCGTFSPINAHSYRLETEEMTVTVYNSAADNTKRPV